jgi:hypothetical protein
MIIGSFPTDPAPESGSFGQLDRICERAFERPLTGQHLGGRPNPETGVFLFIQAWLSLNLRSE